MIERRDGGHLLWGIVLLALGLMFLLGNFGYGTWFGWGRWWPVLLIALGVWLLYQRPEAAGPGTVPAPSPAAAAMDLPAAPPAPAPAGGPAETTRARRLPIGGIILIGIGAAFLLDDVVGGSAFPAIVLITIGVALLLRDRSRP